MELLLQALEALLVLKPVLLAIDGPCGAGKSTLAGRLHEIFPDSALYRMDDFFLQPAMRTEERLATPGGNVDHERFLQQVLLPLEKRVPFAYMRYDCERDTLTPVAATPRALAIIEGCYSLHPALRDHYDLKVFLDIDSETQAKRIVARSPERLAERFFREWIPMENLYFASCGVREAGDIVM